MSACCRDRRKLNPKCTDRIGNWELDNGGIFIQGGQFCSSPGPHPTTTTAADVWLPTQLIGTVVAVPAWRPSAVNYIPVSQITRTGNEMPVIVVDTRVYECAYQSLSNVNGEISTGDLHLSELEETYIRNVVDVPRQHHSNVVEGTQISDTVKVAVRHPHFSNDAVMQMTTGAQPYQLRLWRVETKSVGTHPSLDALDARGHPRS